MKEKILLLILLILIASGVYFFFTFYERYEEEVDIGWSLDAKQNPYLAAELFLAENNIDTHSDIRTQDFEFISQDSTLFIEKADRLLLTNQKIDSALVWAQRGGHLIISASGDTELLSNKLFERLGVKINTDGFYSEEHEEAFETEIKKLSEQLKELNTDAEQQVENEESFDAFKEYIPINFSDGEVLNVGLAQYKSFELIDGADFDILSITENELGIYFLQIAYGSGVISLLPDSELWHSDEIDFLDNAYFLLRLIDSDVFSIMYTGESLSLWQLLKRYAYELILISVIAVFIWVWFSLVRRGRVALPASIARRALSDYVLAMSEFLMVDNHHKPLLEAVKKDVFGALLKRDRSFLNYDLQTQAAMIVEYCQANDSNSSTSHYKLTKESVQQWLDRFEQETMDEVIFVEQVMLSHTIKTRL